jgi:tRNA-specific 2-thiouridylase
MHRVPEPIRIAVGLSGGVDSAVAAWLLQREGHAVVGVTSLNVRESRCCDSRSQLAALEVANRLGIPYHVIDVQRTFRQRVIDPYLEGVKAGVTPNPCVLCNATVRFEELFEEAAWQLDVEAFATGHYARTRRDSESGRWQLLRGRDASKDQSYMLARLDQTQLARARFPLGELTKTEVRRLAAEADLGVAGTPDSQDVCFVMGNTRDFLDRELGPQEPGDIRHVDGRVLGRHEGLAHHTVGQRRGLGLTHPEPLYVVRLDSGRNEVVVGPREAAFRQRWTLAQVHWVSHPPADGPFEAEIQTRYRSPAVAATCRLDADGTMAIEAVESRFAITPGQLAVLYDGDVVIASGTIARDS